MAGVGDVRRTSMFPHKSCTIPLSSVYRFKQIQQPLDEVPIFSETRIRYGCYLVISELDIVEVH